MRRFKLSQGASKRDFSRSGSRTHKRNFSSGPMRGGIRL